MGMSSTPPDLPPSREESTTQPRGQTDLEATSITNFAELQREIAGRQQKTAAYLIVLSGTNVGEMHKLDGPETVLGRGMQATIRLTDEGISRRHARVINVAGQLVIEDLGSANGTIVNGDLMQRKVLADGDKVRLGSNTILKFQHQDKLEESFQQQMYDAALRDGLTKAFNKKYFMDRLDTEFSYARRHRTMLSIVLFDVDHFKRVNDTYGHVAGDFVLTKLSKIAHSCVRAEDVFARYGGEEFGVICRGIPLVNAGVLAERLRSATEAGVFDFQGAKIPVTISVGVAALPESPAQEVMQLIGAADSALYEAKRGGRNRIVLKDQR